METQKVKIDLMKKILAIEDATILTHISSFVDEKIEMTTSDYYYNEEDETKKGIETILKMVKEFK